MWRGHSNRGLRLLRHAVHGGNVEVVELLVKGSSLIQSIPDFVHEDSLLFAVGFAAEIDNERQRRMVVKQRFQITTAEVGQFVRGRGVRVSIKKVLVTGSAEHVACWSGFYTRLGICFTRGQPPVARVGFRALPKTRTLQPRPQWHQFFQIQYFHVCFHTR